METQRLALHKRPVKVQNHMKAMVLQEELRLACRAVDIDA